MASHHNLRHIDETVRIHNIPEEIRNEVLAQLGPFDFHSTTEIFKTPYLAILRREEKFNSYLSRYEAKDATKKLPTDQAAEAG